MIWEKCCGYTGAIWMTEFRLLDFNALIKAGQFQFRNPIEDISPHERWLVILIMDLAVKIPIEPTSESYNSVSGGFERNLGWLICSRSGEIQT